MSEKPKRKPSTRKPKLPNVWVVFDRGSPEWLCDTKVGAETAIRFLRDGKIGKALHPQLSFAQYVPRPEHGTTHLATERATREKAEAEWERKMRAQVRDFDVLCEELYKQKTRAERAEAEVERLKADLARSQGAECDYLKMIAVERAAREKAEAEVERLNAGNARISWSPKCCVCAPRKEGER